MSAIGKRHGLFRVGESHFVDVVLDVLELAEREEKASLAESV